MSSDETIEIAKAELMKAYDAAVDASDGQAEDASLQIKQALADLEAVEKKDAPDLFAGVGS
jgi:hypothetical protein